jgi:hypothetical protein
MNIVDAIIYMMVDLNYIHTNILRCHRPYNKWVVKTTPHDRFTIGFTRF